MGSLKASCEHVIAENNLYTQFNPLTLLELNPELELAQETIDDCVEVLQQMGYLKVKRMLGGYYIYFLTANGFIRYAEHYISSYDNDVEKIISLMINKKINNNYEITEQANLSPAIVDSVLMTLETSGLIKLAKLMGGMIHIHYTHVSTAKKNIRLLVSLLGISL